MGKAARSYPSSRHKRSPSSPDISGTASQTVRLDIWLYRTRLFKSRGLASRLIQNGRLHLTRCGQTQRSRKPHTLVRPGDILTFMRGERLFHIRVLAAGVRRGPASEARELYEIVGEGKAQ